MALDPPTHFQMLFGCLEFSNFAVSLRHLQNNIRVAESARTKPLRADR